MSIKVNLKGDSKEFESGVSVAEIAKSIGAGLYKAALCRKSRRRGSRFTYASYKRL